MAKQCSSCGGFCGKVCQRENVAQPESVALNVTIEGEAAKLLAAMLEPALNGDDPTPIRFMVGNGHSGYGLYVADDEYPEEGANLLVNTTECHLAANFQRFNGVDIQFRRSGTNWPKPYRVQVLTNKNERSEFRIAEFYNTLGEAIEGLKGIVGEQQ